MKNPSIIVLLSLFAATALAAPIPDSLETVELDARNPWVGTLLRGLGRGAKSLPEKAGKKVEKEKGQANVAEGKRLKEVTNRWNKYTGKENDPKCIQGIMNRFSQYGGYNMVIEPGKDLRTRSHHGRRRRLGPLMRGGVFRGMDWRNGSFLSNSISMKGSSWTSMWLDFVDGLDDLE